MTTNTPNSPYRTAYVQERKQTGANLDGSLQLGSGNTEGRCVGGMYATEILGGDGFQLYFFK